MGKKGEALRAAKQQAGIWHFTREQMAEHDRMIIQDYRKRFDANMRAAFEAEEARVNEKINRHLHEEWAKREELFCGAHGIDSIAVLMALTLAVPVAVLLDEFGWRPLLAAGRRMHPRSRLARFALRCQEILEDIASDQTKDIRTYCEEVWKRSGVRLQYTEEEGGT